MSAIICWNCGGSLEDIPRPISRHATCSHCFNELHCCRLCRHYDPKRTMQCFEDRADPPLQKENANFCDFFSPARGAFEAKTTSKSNAARSELDSLFGTPPISEEDVDEQCADNDLAHAPIAEEPMSKEEAAKKKLDDLFN